MSEKYKEIALDAFILCFAIGGILFVNPTGAAVFDGPGGLSWRSLPLLYSGLLLGLALFSIATTLLAPPVDAAATDGPDAPPDLAETEPAGTDDAASNRAHTVRRIGVVLALIAYSQGLIYFGFALSTPPFLFALLALFGRKAWANNLLLSIVGGAALWFLFAYLLRMPLKGSLFDPLTPALLHTLRAVGG